LGQHIAQRQRLRALRRSTDDRHWRELGVAGREQFRRSKMAMIAPRAEAEPK
jgi:hypothetical protein